MADRSTVSPAEARPDPPPVPSRWREAGDHWRLYRHLVVAQIRSEWQYRTSFVFFVLAQAAVTVLELAAILLLLEVVPELGGWDRAQIVLLYGLATVPFALTDVVVSPVEDLAGYVREGTFDRLLLRPMSALVQLCAMEFELRRVGKVVPNLVALVWGLGANDVSWDLRSVVLVVGAMIVGSAVYTALWVLSASTSFWVVSALEATHAFTFGGQFANQYPLHLYPGWVRAVLGWAEPLAFVAYVPTLSLLDAPNPLAVPDWLILVSPVAAAGAIGAALLVWSAGIRHYQGTGS